MKIMTRNREPYNKFKQLLSENNIKQKDLAKTLGKSKSYVNDVLNGRGAGFSLREFRIIKLLFEIEIHEYF